MSIKINKNGKEYPLGFMPEHYPADRVYLFGNTNANVETALTYSETEHIVGKWIDGSTIYEKTVDIGNLPNATSKSVAHGITNLDKVISIEGFARGGNNRVPLPYVATVSTNNVAVSANNTNIAITAGGDSSSYSGYVTLRYTKA